MLVWSVVKFQRGILNETISSDIVERERALVKAQICNVTVIIYFFPPVLEKDRIIRVAVFKGKYRNSDDYSLKASSSTSLACK